MTARGCRARVARLAPPVMQPVHIVGLSGSLRAGSLNTRVLRAVPELLPEGASFELLDLREVPLYDEDLRAQGTPPAVAALAARVHAADAVLFATPEYNYSVPGVLKNTIDWLSRSDPQPFRDKAVGIVGATPGMLGTARAQYHLRQILVFLDAHPVNKPEVMIGGADKKLDADGRLSDPTTRELLRKLLAALATHSRRLRAGAAALSG